MITDKRILRLSWGKKKKNNILHNSSSESSSHTLLRFLIKDCQAYLSVISIILLC